MKKLLLAICLILLGFVTSFSQDTPESEDNTIFTLVQQKPEFPGDINKFLSDNIVYPADAKNKNIQGTVYVSFVVEKDGSVSTVKVLRGLEGGQLLEDEAVRVVSLMPKWKPGMQNGKYVRVQYMVPIRFILRDGNLNIPKTVVNQTGCVSGDCQSGPGTYIYSNGDKYEGDFKNGERTGQGTITYNNGNKYTGEFSNGLGNGQGTYYYSNGDKYVGKWKYFKRNGQGTYYSANGEEKTGEWKDGEFVGQGTVNSAQPGQTGCISGDCMNGTGTFIDTAGRYEGEFKNGKYDGQGTYYWTDGRNYVGGYKDGERSGQGTITFPAGDKYVGEFKNNSRNGYGTYFFSNGNKYMGEIRDRRFEGQGTFYFANGDKYVGEMKDDKFNGQGTYYFTNGEKKSGEWKDGKYVGKGNDESIHLGKTITVINNNSGSNSVEKKVNASFSSDVDKDIPVEKHSDENKFALIIGNEDYTTYQPDLSSEMNVAYAVNDATVFKDYCVKTFGVPEDNIIFLKNATLAKVLQGITKINKLIQATNGKADVMVYYAGHGLPDENTHEPYLIPVDVSGSDLSSAIKLSYLYDKLTEFPSQKVTVFLDACFSGGGRDAGLLAARGVKVTPKSGTLKGNIVVFAASSADESSMLLKSQQHGMFTYYLLKEFQQTKGNVSFADLSAFLKDKVEIESLKINDKDQHPQVIFSNDDKDSWGNWKLK